MTQRQVCGMSLYLLSGLIPLSRVCFGIANAFVKSVYFLTEFSY